MHRLPVEVVLPIRETAISNLSASQGDALGSYRAATQAGVHLAWANDVSGDLVKGAFDEWYIDDGQLVIRPQLLDQRQEDHHHRPPAQDRGRQATVEPAQPPRNSSRPARPAAVGVGQRAQQRARAARPAALHEKRLDGVYRMAYNLSEADMRAHMRVRAHMQANEHAHATCATIPEMHEAARCRRGPSERPIAPTQYTVNST